MSVIGVSFQEGSIPEYQQLIDKQLAAALFFGNALDPGTIERMALGSPNTRIAVRYAGADEGFHNEGRTDKQFVDQWLAQALPGLERVHKWARIAQFLNEPQVGDPRDTPLAEIVERAKRLNGAQVLFNDEMHARGWETSSLTNSVGTPILNKFNRFSIVEHLIPCLKTADYYGYHAYGAPRLLSDSDALIFRYRAFYDEVLALDPSAIKPIFCGEFGIDLSAISNAKERFGARENSGGYKNITTMADFAGQIKEVDGIWLRRPPVHWADAWICGVTQFVYCNSDAQWASFDPSDVEDDRKQFIGALSAGSVWTRPALPAPPEANMQAWYPKAERKNTDKMFPEFLNRPVRAVVLHIAEGSYQAAVDWLTSDANQNSSAHFVIAKDGRIAQLVPIDRRAWANGTIAGATWPGLIAGVNPNLYTISIEHEGFWNEPRTPAMDAALAELLAWLRVQTGLTWKAHDTLIGHYELDRVQRPNCPGPHVDYEAIAAAGNGQPPIVNPPEEIMRTAQDIKRASWKSIGVTFNDQQQTAFEAKAKALGLGYPLGEEYRDVDGGVTIAGQAFGPEGVALETVEGVWAQDQIKPFSILTGLPWVRPAPAQVPVGVGKQLPYLFPRTLTEIGALGEEGTPLDGQPFYRIAGATVRRGVNAFAVVTVFTNAGTPAIGVKVANLFPDGNGEWQETDGSGVARFQFGASSAFTNPGSGPFTIVLVDDASKDNDAIPKRLKIGRKLSDTAKSLGDFQSEHTEIYLQFIQQ